MNTDEYSRAEIQSAAHRVAFVTPAHAARTRGASAWSLDARLRGHDEEAALTYAELDDYILEFR